MINVKCAAGITHCLKWADTTKCGRKTLWAENWVGTRDPVDCITCLVSDESGYYACA